MEHILNSLFQSVIILLPFLPHISLVIAALPNPQYLPVFPLPLSSLSSLDTTKLKITIPNLDFLKYVCPTQNEVNKRQGLETITINKSEIREILRQIRQLEGTFMDLMDEIVGVLPDFKSQNVDEDTGAQLETTSTTTIEKTTAIENWVTVTNQWPPFTASEYTVVADPTLVPTVEAHPLIPQVSTSIVTTASAFLADIGPIVSAASDYIFNAKSNSNIAIYYGQSPLTSSSLLSTQCADPAIDIVIVAFVTSQSDFLGTSKYPTVNFGAACNFDQTPLMASQARGLLYCPDLAREIEICQGVGKKVLLSLGGYTGTIAFGSEEEAIGFAGVLWGLFGPWEGNEVKIDEGLRPFGRTVLDGFDIDSENNQPQYYETLAKTFRYLFSTVSDKPYYLSSAPQCPFSDASNPTSMLLLCDFIFVQFYNNPSCEVGSSGYDASIKQWASALKGGEKDRSLKWFLGAPAWSAAGPTAYANIGSAEAMKAVARHVASEGFDNFGGVMFWAGPEGLANVGGGKSIVAWAKEGLDI